MTFMTAVFSYNRGQLLSNCVRSIERFSPDTTVVVFDDRSDDPQTLEALDQIAARGHEVIVNDHVSVGEHGNHLANLRESVQAARGRGYRLLHLVEDDSQFVWRSPGLVEHVQSLFDAFPDAAQVSPLFWKLASKASGDVFRHHAAYRLRQPPSCMIGFVDVERLESRGLRHLGDELETTKLGAALGLELLALAYPVVTRVPWPMYTRHRVRMGKPLRVTKPFLVRPLTETEIHRLGSRSLEVPPYSEHYCIPWGWRCWSPYGWTASYRTWARTLLVVALRRRSIKGLIPHRVGDPD
jgi:hypothetical protein